MQTLRSGAKRSGFDGKSCQAGALYSLYRIMTVENLTQNRMDWVEKDLKISSRGDILYFVGCVPYFDVIFSDLNLDTLEAPLNSIKILNKLGISPVVLPNERCCGHDLLWNGDVANFRKLAEHNIVEIEKSGAKTILFSCAECLSAFKSLYPGHGFRLNASLKHISQFLSEKVSSGELKLAESDIELTYQDPCRLGRHLGIYDEPRQLLQESNSSHYHEMRQNMKGSLCCGVSAWMNCDVYSKAIQTERLKQARQSGAEVMAVACPKCQIHLTCVMKDKSVRENYAVKIRDISSIVLERME
jgi:Fe-S oxidoreductase